MRGEREGKEKGKRRRREREGKEKAKSASHRDGARTPYHHRGED